MVIKSELKLFEPGEINFQPSPPITTDYIQIGFGETKKGNELELRLTVRYIVAENTNPSNEWEVALAHVQFRITTDGIIFIEELYDHVIESVYLVNTFINTMAKFKGVPEVHLGVPSLEDLRGELQPIVDMFMASNN